MFSEATYEMTAGAFTPEDEADKRLMVQFNYHPHLDQEASSKEGRPIYKDRVYVMIIVPGDKDSIVHRPAYDMDFRRFPNQYRAFQNKETQAVQGTPLKIVPWLTTSQIKELAYFNVNTVEQLAGVSDNLAPNFHGLQRFKKMAGDFLRAASEAAPLTEMRAQLEERDAQIKALQEQMAQLAKSIEGEKAAKPKEK